MSEREVIGGQDDNKQVVETTPLSGAVRDTRELASKFLPETLGKQEQRLEDQEARIVASFLESVSNSSGDLGQKVGLTFVKNLVQGIEEEMLKRKLLEVGQRLEELLPMFPSDNPNTRRVLIDLIKGIPRDELMDMISDTKTFKNILDSTLNQLSRYSNRVFPYDIRALFESDFKAEILGDKIRSIFIEGINEELNDDDGIDERRTGYEIYKLLLGLSVKEIRLITANKDNLIIVLNKPPFDSMPYDREKLFNFIKTNL